MRMKGQNPNEVLLAAAESEDKDKVSQPKQQWIQKNGPGMGMLMSTTFPYNQRRSLFY